MFTPAALRGDRWPRKILPPDHHPRHEACNAPEYLLLDGASGLSTGLAVPLSERDWRCLLNPSWPKPRASARRCLAATGSIEGGKNDFAPHRVVQEVTSG